MSEIEIWNNLKLHSSYVVDVVVVVVAAVVVVDVSIVAVQIVGVIRVVRVNRRRPPRTRICTHPKAALVCGIWVSINHSGDKRL